MANGVGTNGVTVRLVVTPELDADDVSGTVSWCLATTPRLGQVFNNLIDNARSFSEEGGCGAV